VHSAAFHGPVVIYKQTLSMQLSNCNNAAWG